MPADNLQKASTTKSAIGLVVIGLMLVVLGLVVYYVLTIPGVLESLLNVFVIGVIVLAAIAIIFYIIVAIIAIPMYAHKGEQYQVGVDYSLDDVESVKEKDSEDSDR